MNTKILVTILSVTFLGACGKDKYETKPQLTYKNVNTTVLQSRQALTFAITVTDKEGDIQDSIFVEKVVPQCPASNFKAGYPMPQFAPIKNLSADVEITYAYNNNDLGYPPLKGPACPRNDTAYFRFWIKDKAKNTSDTISSEQIVILR